MVHQIRKAAVIGSGVMGAGIAAHLANTGITCLLLDIVLDTLTKEEESQGLTLQSSAVRNRRATEAIKRLKKQQPAPLYDAAFSSRIIPGNIDDHLDQIRGVDWVIEAVVEQLQVKQALYERIERYWSPGIIVSSNTSGISINEMVASCSEVFQRHFLGTHFFNPPRYMKLLELIPGQRTDEDIVQRLSKFCEKSLGKGVVKAKDTPNFIANRIGTYGLLVTLKEMQARGFTVEEIDAVTGPALGRPKSATFRTLDVVGLDTFVHVAGNVYHKVTQAEEKSIFEVPDLLRTLVARGWTGEKVGQGFYKKVKEPQGTAIQVLDLSTLEYRPRQTITSASLEAAKQAKGAKASIRALLKANDRYAELAWAILKQVLIYAAEKAYEISDSILDIDRAMKWGFNWELGPFETWDAIGLVYSVQRMEAEGTKVPEWVKAWISKGHESFYLMADSIPYVASHSKYKAIEQPEEHIALGPLKEQRQVMCSNAGASLIDIGDGVACLEFHSPNNAIGADILMMIQKSIEEVRQHYDGLVIANEGKNFCVGANLMLLLMEAQDEEWDEVDLIIRLFQDTMLKLKHFEKPVVAAPHRMTLGGGVEVCMPADRVCALAETYYGLVEVGVGLIPAGGGCKELALRVSQKAVHPHVDLQPFVNHAFETIGKAKVSTSAYDAKRLGLLQAQDRVVMHPDHLIYEAKQSILQLVQSGYSPVSSEVIQVVGRDGKAVLQLAAYDMRQAGYISEHDELIARKLAHVLTGGDVPAGSRVSEQYLLDLEREAFLSLCGEPKTQARMQHMLTKGKPLRN